MIVLRLIHIGNGVFWAGGVFITAMFLIPGVRDTGPAGGAFMRHLLMVQKFPMRITSAAILTILSGIALYWIDTSSSSGAFTRTAMGIWFGIGGGAGLLALVPGIGILAPTSKRLA